MLLSTLGEILFKHSQLFLFLQKLFALFFVDLEYLNVRIYFIQLFTKITDLLIYCWLLLSKESDLFIFECVINLRVCQMVLKALANNL